MDNEEKNNNREFIIELKTLLKKYNASIEFMLDDCSDLYGISGEEMSIQINDKEILTVKG